MRLDLYSGDVRLQERFHREARSTAALRHPNIVTVFDINEADGQLFIAMEYLEGRTLLELLREGPLAIADTLRWVDELCDALSYAHQRGVIHRDVKPSNLMIQPDGHLKVMDFGIAREVDSGLTRAGDILGTLNYMAPERLTGRPIDHRSDIFDVGAVFYEAVTGKKAFPGDQPAVIAQDILHKQPEPIVHVVPAIDPRIVAIIERCLQKAPEGRYDSLIDMRRDLEPLLRGRDRHDPLLATPIGRFDAQPVGPAPVSVPLPPPSVTRPADVVIRLTGAPAREPLDADGARHFVGRSAELNTMARQVASARGGSFLITGYRGIGKTSFVNQLVALVTQDLERAHGPTLVVVRVEVPTRLEPAQLMHRILTRLAAELEARNIEERLPAKLRNTIAGAMRRTKFDVKETSGRESETGVDAELSGPGAKLSGGRKHKVTSGSELRSLTYDDQAAEADLIRISRALSTGHTPEASWWQRILQSFGKAAAATVKFRVVFVIDELDKLDQETPADRPAALDAVFSSLKTLLTTSGMTFVFVGGRDMQDRWYQDVTRGDSIYQSVSSHHAYLPCLWTEVSSVCDSLLQPSRDNGAPVLDHFRGFIRYKGRGIPRLALDSMRQFVDWQPEPA
jgi:hypothetical protein